MYRFITLKPEVDPQDSAKLNYRLSLARNKKMAIGGEIELNYSNLAQSTRSLIGIGGNITYRNRNIFRGAELFSTNIQAGVEVNLDRSAGSNFNSANFNWRNNLLIPRFIDPIGFYSFLNSVRPWKNGLIGDRTFGWLKEGNTSVTAGYQYLSLFNLYSFHSLTVALGYDAQPDARRRLQLNHIGLDFFNPTIKPDFDTILIENIFLRESFRKQLFSGFLFRDYRFTYSRQSPHGISRVVTHSAELSGLEIFAVNTLYNSLSNSTGAFELGKENPLSFSQYAKFEIDASLRYQLATNQQLAFRAATGVAVPYGPFSRQVPYIKQFYVGGPSSIRAWQIRELGPGGYRDPFVEQDTSNLPFYQTGDLKLELSAEYRFDLFWVFKGAVFIDAGNVWITQKDVTRPGAVFTFDDFTKQIAVGTGIGFRMDFDYFLIRLDFGYKLRQPYPDEMGRYWLFHNFKDLSFRQITTNFAIGYPF
jgi:hypothetical protein